MIDTPFFAARYSLNLSRRIDSAANTLRWIRHAFRAVAARVTRPTSKSSDGSVKPSRKVLADARALGGNIEGAW